MWIKKNYNYLSESSSVSITRRFGLSPALLGFLERFAVIVTSFVATLLVLACVLGFSALQSFLFGIMQLVVSLVLNGVALALRRSLG